MSRISLILNNLHHFKYPVLILIIDPILSMNSFVVGKLIKPDSKAKTKVTVTLGPHS